MLKTRGDIFISIRSRDLISTSIGDNNNSGRFNLFENILATDTEILSVELVSATIPNSFYNLSANNNNNTIKFKEGLNNYVTLTIPSGSYDILELGSKIKTLLEAQSIIFGNSYTYTFIYDVVNNLLTITNSGNDATFDFTTDISCRRFLGFTSSIQIINSSAGIISNRAVDITDTRNSIFVRLPNLSNNKTIESSSGKFSNIIAQVPVALSRNTFFTFDPATTYKCELSQKQINSIDILITYQDETNNVNFERADWEINLIVSFHEAPKDIINARNKEMGLREELYNRVNDYHINKDKMITEQKELNQFFQDGLKQIESN
tara:strand:- start:206 stop:1168 length:963 start_codon:yes stop_codon:yes gene_type:complete